jgi:hypothetical protein
MGADLYPTVLRYWLREHRYGGRSGLPAELLHRKCGRSMLPTLLCRRCGQPLDVASIHVEVVAKPDERQVRLPKYCLHDGDRSWRGSGAQALPGFAAAQRLTTRSAAHLSLLFISK